MSNAYTIAVDNLKCHGCANTITKSISKLNGVNQVEVDVEHGTVSVLGSNACDRELLVKTLSKLGYPEHGTSTDLQKVKSYVSCAVGRIS